MSRVHSHSGCKNFGEPAGPCAGAMSNVRRFCLTLYCTACSPVLLPCWEGLAHSLNAFRTCIAVSQVDNPGKVLAMHQDFEKHTCPQYWIEAAEGRDFCTMSACRWDFICEVYVKHQIGTKGVAHARS